MGGRGDGRIQTLFLDIGGVLLTNGWDHHARQRACQHFKLEYEELNERHHLTFDTYEVGKLSLDEYLRRVVFYQPRDFTPDDFRQFMFAQSQPLPDMLALIRTLKQRYGLQIVAVSNEGRELTVYRIEQFKLRDIFDGFISSCFVHFRKPDADMYAIALDVSQAAPEEVVYVDDRRMFVEVSQGLGINGIWHTGFDTTKKALADFGLVVEG
jgi:putative hydrolase of the HAD superfamily